MFARHSIAALLLCLTASQFATTPGAAQTRDHVDVPRDQWQRVADIFRELGVAPGRHIADIGAGGGYFTTRLARAVGPSGAVLAVDVNPVSLRELKQSLGADGANVEVIRGDEDDPHLPAGRLDGVLVVNAYHEFFEHAAMLRHVLAALKPSGRLVIVEPIPRVADTTREAQTRRHAIAIAFVEDDLKQAGRVLAGFLHGVTPLDPLVFLGASGVSLLLAGMAAWQPARQAARIDAVETLKSE